MPSRKIFAWCVGAILLLSALGWLMRDRRDRQDPALFVLGLPAYARDVEYYRKDGRDIVRFNAVASSRMVEQFYLERVAQVWKRDQYVVIKRDESMTVIQLVPNLKDHEFDHMLFEFHFELPVNELAEQHFELQIGLCGMAAVSGCATKDLSF